MGIINYLSENIGTLCQIVLTVIAIVTLIFTTYNFRLSVKSNEKNSKIETSNEMYDLLLRCKRITTNVNGNLTFFIVKKELWNIVDDMMEQIKPLPNTGGKKARTFTYHGVELLDDIKEAYVFLEKYFDDNIEVISRMRSDQNQVVQFDNEMLMLDICMKSKFSQNVELCDMLDEFTSNLTKYKDLCLDIVKDKEDEVRLNYLNDLASIICPEKFSKKTMKVAVTPNVSEEWNWSVTMEKHDETLDYSENNLNTYINALIINNRVALNSSKESIKEAYDKIETFISPKK